MDSSSILTNLMFLVATAAMLGIVFLILLAVGHKRNKAFRRATPQERAALFAREPRARDIVLLTDGTRVTLTEAVDGGVSFMAQTLADYGKPPEQRTVTRTEIVKIEYYS